MGLDTVELVMEVEEAFNMTIPSAEAVKIETIGDLIDFVTTHLRSSGQLFPGGSGEPVSRCLSAITFYCFRRRLISCLKVRRADIRPETALESLIPPANRRVQWRQLEESLGWKLPSLARPPWLGNLIFCLVLSSTPVGFLICHVAGHRNDAAFLSWGLGSLLLASFISAVLYELTIPIAIRFPSETVRGLIPLLLGPNLSLISNPSAGWTRGDVRELVITIVATQMGVTAESLTDATDFVKDLGAD